MKHKKIDIYTSVNVFGMRTPQKSYKHFCSTQWAKTCKEAKARFCAWHRLKPEWVKAEFAK
jgi:hypothetical protein